MRDPQPCRRFDGGAHGLGAGAMPGDTRLISAGRPPAVAVHNYCDVRRESVGVDLSQEELVYGAAFDDALKLSKDINAHYFRSDE